MIQLLRSTIPALLLAVAACGGSSASSGGGDTTPPPPAGPTCAEAGTTIAAQMAKEIGNSAMEADAASAITAACTEGAWSPELITCTMDAARASSGECDPMFSDSQKQIFMEKLAPLMGGAGAGETGGGEDLMEDPCAGGE